MFEQEDAWHRLFGLRDATFSGYVGARQFQGGLCDVSSNFYTDHFGHFFIAPPKISIQKWTHCSIGIIYREYYYYFNQLYP